MGTEHSFHGPPNFFYFFSALLSSDVLSGYGIGHVKLALKYNYLIFFLGNHTFAAVKADEGFDMLCTTLREPIEVNQLIGTSQIEVGDRVIELDFYLGGDYKV